MAEQDIKDEMEVKFHFVLPGQVWGKYKSGEVVELTAGQAYGWEGVKVSKGYVTENGAQNASGRLETPKREDAPKADAKEVTNVKQ